MPGLSRRLVPILFELTTDRTEAESSCAEFFDVCYGLLLSFILQQGPPVLGEFPSVRYLAGSLVLGDLEAERVPGPLADQVPLHLVQARHHVQKELPHGGLRIDPVKDRVEGHLMLFNELQKEEGINNSSREPIELVDHDNVDRPGLYEASQDVYPFPVEVLSGLTGVLDDVHEVKIVDSAVGLDLNALVLKTDTFSGLFIGGNSNVADGFRSTPFSFLLLCYYLITLLQYTFNVNTFLLRYCMCRDNILKTLEAR